MSGISTIVQNSLFYVCLKNMNILDEKIILTTGMHNQYQFLFIIKRRM